MDQKNFNFKEAAILTWITSVTTEKRQAARECGRLKQGPSGDVHGRQLSECSIGKGGFRGDLQWQYPRVEPASS